MNNASRHRRAETAGKRRLKTKDRWQTAVAFLADWCSRLFRRVRTAARPMERERGDVPGWVMITLMSAILVAGLLFIAEPALEQLFRTAMEQVKP